MVNVWKSHRICPVCTTEMRVAAVRGALDNSRRGQQSGPAADVPPGQDEDHKLVLSSDVILLDEPVNLQQRTRLMTLNLQEEAFNRFSSLTDSRSDLKTRRTCLKPDHPFLRRSRWSQTFQGHLDEEQAVFEVVQVDLKEVTVVLQVQKL